jgi:hypothetical protein
MKDEKRGRWREKDVTDEPGWQANQQFRLHSADPAAQALQIDGSLPLAPMTDYLWMLTVVLPWLQSVRIWETAPNRP